jgi:hypothetical protein
MGPVSGVTFIYGFHVGHSTLADHGWRPDPPRGLGARRRCFLALMVGALGSTTPAPPRGPAFDVCYVDGGRSRISVSTSQRAQGPADLQL